MKILIISTNRYRQPFAIMPFGACIIAESARMEGHDVKLLDLMFESYPIRAVTKAVRDNKPEIIGLSIRNIDNNDMQRPEIFFKDLLPIVNIIRKETGAVIILGGAAMGTMPEHLLRYTGINLGVAGNGEKAFPRLISAISKNMKPHDIPGVCRIEDGVFKQNAPSFSDYLKECPVPNYRRWLRSGAYLSRLSTAPIQSKRGCPFDCIYCTYAINEGRNYHLFSPESVVETVRGLVEDGFRDVEFVDNVFNSPYEHAMAICEKLAEARTGARLQSLELNPRFLDERILDAMERAGFVGIGITAESASDIVLNKLRKGFTVEELRSAANVIRDYKLPCVWIFMLGGPGETEATVTETLDFAARYVRPNDAAFFNIGIRLYPGTEIERIARREGSLLTPQSDMLSPKFYLSPEVDLAWLVRTLDKAVEKNLNFLSSNSITSSLLPIIYRIGYNLGVKPPLWRHAVPIRRALRSVGINI